jgi:hypothetical protein
VDVDTTSGFSRLEGRHRECDEKGVADLFGHILRENRSVIEFLNADYTFLNDKLARYYGIKV